MSMYEAIKQFVTGRETGSQEENVYVKDKKLIHSNTVVAQWIEGNIVLNVTKYPHHMSDIQSKLLHAFPYCQKVDFVYQSLTDLKPYLKN